MDKFFIKFFLLILPFQIFANFSDKIDISLTRLLIAVLFFWLIIRFIRNKQLFKEFYKSSELRLLCLFIITVSISLIVADNHNWALRKLIFWLNIAGVLPVFIFFIYKNNKENILKYLIYSLFIVLIIALFQFSSQFFAPKASFFEFIGYAGKFLWGENFSKAVLNMPSWYANISGKDVLRAFLPFPDPHSLAIYLNLVYPLVFVGYFANFFKKRAFFILIAGILIVLAFTFSRAGYIVFLIENVLLILFLPSARKFSSAVLFVLVLFFIFAPFISDRFLEIFNLKDFSSAGRINLWKESWDLFLKNPVSGIGLGNFSYYMNRFLGYYNPINAHSFYLEILSEAGFFALFFWILFFILTIFKAIRNNLFIFAIPLAGFLIHNIFETAVYNAPNLALVFIICALILISDKNYNLWPGS